jgi:hypothetical protein
MAYFRFLSDNEDNNLMTQTITLRLLLFGNLVTVTP